MSGTTDESGLPPHWRDEDGPPSYAMCLDGEGNIVGRKAASFAAADDVCQRLRRKGIGDCWIVVEADNPDKARKQYIAELSQWGRRGRAGRSATA